MIIIFGTSPHLMETFRHWRSRYGYVLLFLLAAISKGSACGALSSPQCFRRNEVASIYICEWSFNTNESDVTFTLYFTDIFGIEKKIENIKKNHKNIIEEEEDLTVSDRVDIWVEAHVGNATCTSPNVSGLLIDSVKYDAPHNILASWLRNNLSLSWQAAERYPALAEVCFKKHGNLLESCEKRLINTTNEASKYNVVIVNLMKSSAYQVRIRHLATKYKVPLWSNWSPFITVPAALDCKLEVNHTSRLLNGTRQVTLTWKPIPHQATLRGVTYSVTDTHSSHGCPCKRKKSQTSRDSNHHTLHVSYSAVNITVVARNEAGKSPETVLHVPAASAADLKICDQTLLNEKLKRRTCLELYELQDADLNPESVIVLTARKQKKGEGIKSSMKNFTRYLYFEHRCHNGKPRTVKVCLFYLKEGAPNKEPQYDKTIPKTHSVYLSWKEISFEHHRGFLTNYSLCSMKISPQKEPKECFNISASMTEHHLENLTPGAKYNITLAGVTRAGEGLLAAQIIETLQEKPVNVWLSFGLLVVFFIFSAVCTVIIKRIKAKIFPPIPRSVILDFIPRYPEKEQEMCDTKEEVHELTLYQPGLEETPVLGVLKGEWDDTTDEDMEKERSDSAGSDDECLSLDSAVQTLSKSQMAELEQAEAELARLIYRSGLVFDVKSESS
nr:interleukin-6 receptor subunit beta isoform X2 [Nothobranchius furzeri]